MTLNGKNFYKGSSFGPKIGFRAPENRLIAIRGSFNPLNSLYP